MCPSKLFVCNCKGITKKSNLGRPSSHWCRGWFIYVIWLLLLGSSWGAHFQTKGSSFHPHSQISKIYPDGSYKFSYDTGQGEHKSFRIETRSKGGTVSGTFGYVDPQGFLRVTRYVADQYGYRATEETYHPVSIPPKNPLIIGPIPQEITSDFSTEIFEIPSSFGIPEFESGRIRIDRKHATDPRHGPEHLQGQEPLHGEKEHAVGRKSESTTNTPVDQRIFNSREPLLLIGQIPRHLRNTRKRLAAPLRRDGKFPFILDQRNPNFSQERSGILSPMSEPTGNANLFKPSQSNRIFSGFPQDQLPSSDLHDGQYVETSFEETVPDVEQLETNLRDMPEISFELLNTQNLDEPYNVTGLNPTSPDSQILKVIFRSHRSNEQFFFVFVKEGEVVDSSTNGATTNIGKRIFGKANPNIPTPNVHLNNDTDNRTYNKSKLPLEPSPHVRTRPRLSGKYKFSSFYRHRRRRNGKKATFVKTFT